MTFGKCVDADGINVNAGLIMDVRTRWSLIFYMLERALRTVKCLLSWRYKIGETISFCLQLRNGAELRIYVFFWSLLLRLLV